MSKEKQIEEMAKSNCAFCRSRTNCKLDTCDCAYEEAEHLYNAGYRKQSEGEWETIADYSRSLTTYRHICSECKTFYKDLMPHGHKFCHECGAKMKGE